MKSELFFNNKIQKGPKVKKPWNYFNTCKYCNEDFKSEKPYSEVCPKCVPTALLKQKRFQT